MPNVTETVACTSQFALADQFFDWFCRDESLPRRALALQAKLATVAASPKIDASLGVIFKNNQPACSSQTYDDFRLVDLVSGDVVWTVVPRDPRGGKAEVWGRGDDGRMVMLVEGSWRDVVRFFLPVVPVEVYGSKGLRSKPFRKVFPSQAALEKWVDANGSDVTILGWRQAEG